MSDINVYVTSDLTSSERRISPQWDLAYLKSRLELITGISPRYQTIMYFPVANSNQYQTISDATKYNPAQDKAQTVADFNIVALGRLHVIDTNPDSQLHELEDNEANKDIGYQLSEEEYAKMSGTVLDWKQQNKLGRFNPQYSEEKQRQILENEQLSNLLKVGSRCRIINISSERRGYIRFVGRVDVLDKGENVWVGIEFDEPVGKNNGLIDGKVIFKCRDKHGSFVKPKQVEVGDFPEVDPFESDEEEL